MKKLHGTGVALVTPFDESGHIDFAALKKVLVHTAKGVDYYVVMGTTGESVTLTKEEKKKVLSFVIQNNPKKLPIVYGIGGNNTAAVLEELQHTDLDHVDAILSVSPAYNKPSQEGIFRHFSIIANISPLPLVLYNVPGRTASNMTAETIVRLAGNKNIIGVKEASGSLEQCMKIAKDKPSEFMLISGDDLLTLPMYAIGAVGVISVLANAFPGVFKAMKECALDGNYPKAQQALNKIVDINAPMYEESNPVGVKQLLSEMGICGPHVRLPLVPASDKLAARIKALYSATKKGQR
ncbi:MAG TPA: 4-hydroxy-tetrahydrodipicolinate synthase [Cyclobacteriaceae bacterium]|nr:4-hydroxy-tetrahydrodipicolinate synthase [Cyclobacteriaceae bacterium]